MPRRVVLVSDLQRGAKLDALGDFEWPSDVELDLRVVASAGSNATPERLADAARPGLDLDPGRRRDHPRPGGQRRAVETRVVPPSAGSTPGAGARRPRRPPTSRRARAGSSGSPGRPRARPPSASSATTTRFDDTLLLRPRRPEGRGHRRLPRPRRPRRPDGPALLPAPGLRGHPGPDRPGRRPQAGRPADGRRGEARLVVVAGRAAAERAGGSARQVATGPRPWWWRPGRGGPAHARHPAGRRRASSGRVRRGPRRDARRGRLRSPPLRPPRRAAVQRLHQDPLLEAPAARARRPRRSPGPRPVRRRRPGRGREAGRARGGSSS